MEIGGASAQITFAANDLDEKNTFDIELDGKSWRVFKYLDGYEASWTLGYLITTVNREPEQ